MLLEGFPLNIHHQNNNSGGTVAVGGQVFQVKARQIESLWRHVTLILISKLCPFVNV